MCTYVRVEILTTALGSGLPCNECGQPITTSQVECRAGGTRLHQWCHYAKLQATGRQFAALDKEVA
jgi:hypothetical protein